MRSKVLIFLVLLRIVPCSQAANSGPIDCTHLLAWTAGVVPARKLTILIESRGISFTATEKVLNEFRVAGAGSHLMDSLQSAKAQGSLPCSSRLVEAARLVHVNDLDDASDLLDSLLDDHPKNDALHFLWGYVKQRQSDWNGAFDEYSAS